MRLRGIAVAVAAGAVLMAAAPAEAAVTPNTFTEVFNSTALAQFSRGSTTATCPAGTALVSAGGGGVDSLNSITPTAFGTAATVNGSAGLPGESVYAQAQCAPTAQFAGSFAVQATFPN